MVRDGSAQIQDDTPQWRLIFCRCSVWNLLRVTVVAPRTLRWLLGFWKIFTALFTGINFMLICTQVKSAENLLGLRIKNTSKFARDLPSA
jgi:hypothetical protein